MTTATFKVTGMKCGGCEKTVQAAADAVDGVLSSQASSSEGTLTVEFDAAKTSADAIKSAVSAKGYPAS
jgi:copper chaperone